jgi:replication factor C subunit 1
MRRLNSTSLQFDDVKSTATKDLELGAFNAADKCVLRLHFLRVSTHTRMRCRLMSAEARMPINERMNLVFQDSDILPLFVQARPTARPGAALLRLTRTPGARRRTT